MYEKKTNKVKRVASAHQTLKINVSLGAIGRKGRGEVSCVGLLY
jgi:hypothetical protein